MAAMQIGYLALAIRHEEALVWSQQFYMPSGSSDEEVDAAAIEAMRGLCSQVQMLNISSW